MARAKILKHMADNDAPLFASYLFSEEGQTFTNWEFDICVGDPEMPGPFYPQSAREAAYYLNSLKIDAIGWLLATPLLIECKPDAGCGAIGQIVTYQTWFNVIFGIRPRGMIVCKKMSRQIEYMCLVNEILVRRVLPADPLTVQQATQYVRSRIPTRPILRRIDPFI